MLFPVSRIFPTDDSEACAPGEHDQALEDVIHEALTKHFQGLKFRERNAGTKVTLTWNLGLRFDKLYYYHSFILKQFKLKKRPDFEWSKQGRFANGLEFKLDLNQEAWSFENRLKMHAIV